MTDRDSFLQLCWDIVTAPLVVQHAIAVAASSCPVERQLLRYSRAADRLPAHQRGAAYHWLHCSRGCTRDTIDAAAERLEAEAEALAH